LGRDRGHVVVIGAGIWGSFAAYELLQRGATVTLVDQYGPGNSRATSGDETRGVRSSYGDRATGELWMQWAREAMTRWQDWDAEWSTDQKLNLYFKTGDVIMRAAEEPFTTRTVEWWKKYDIPHEVITAAEVSKRWPHINTDGMTVAITEPDAGVVRARRAVHAVAGVVEALGGKIVIGRARLGTSANGQLDGVVLDDGQVIRGDRYVFACGPWLPKVFPEIMGRRMRLPLGYVVYFGTPVGDTRFQYPNMPSWNVPGVTGWPTLPVDSRGFRVRGSMAAPLAAGSAAPSSTPARPDSPPDPAQSDPDTSVRWTSDERIMGSRRVLQARFPALANAPVLETRACHYESSINRDFVVDNHPELSNVWLTGCGNAEGFKFGPVIGAYIAQRVLGDEGDPEVAARFRIPKEEYDPPAPPSR
jgi:glycine/D-amino acid oxidase-like deaminating enzyme